PYLKEQPDSDHDRSQGEQPSRAGKRRRAQAAVRSERNHQDQSGQPRRSQDPRPEQVGDAGKQHDRGDQQHPEEKEDQQARSRTVRAKGPLEATRGERDRPVRDDESEEGEDHDASPSIASTWGAWPARYKPSRKAMVAAVREEVDPDSLRKQRTTWKTARSSAQSRHSSEGVTTRMRQRITRRPAAIPIVCRTAGRSSGIGAERTSGGNLLSSRLQGLAALDGSVPTRKARRTPRPAPRSQTPELRSSAQAAPRAPILGTIIPHAASSPAITSAARGS